MGEGERRRAAVSVLLASDEPLTRAGWRSMIATLDGIAVAAEVDSAGQAESALAERQVDVVVLDPRMESGAGLESIQRIRRRSPQTSIVVVTSSDRPDLARLCFESGALAFIAKTDRPEDLEKAIVAASEGTEYRQPSLAGLLDREPLAESEISGRERDVLRLLALGHTNREIARRLYLSVRTVETHRASLLRKLGASSRADLVAYALGNGLVEGIS